LIPGILDSKNPRFQESSIPGILDPGTTYYDASGRVIGRARSNRQWAPCGAGLTPAATTGLSACARRARRSRRAERAFAS
jgi:hypothetical protein